MGTGRQLAVSFELRQGWNVPPSSPTTPPSTLDTRRKCVRAFATATAPCTPWIKTSRTTHTHRERKRERKRERGREKREKEERESARDRDRDRDREAERRREREKKRESGRAERVRSRS